MGTVSLINRSVARLFYQLSHWRGKRIFHPVGVVCQGSFSVLPEAASVVPTKLFAAAKTYPAIVRLSSGIGLPQFMPDVLGFAVRLPDCYGPNRHQDFLMVTTGSRPILRRIFFVTRYFWQWPYCTVLTYRTKSRRLLFAVLPPQVTTKLARRKVADELPSQLKDGPLRLVFAAVTPGGKWQTVASLELLSIADQKTSEQLQFNPWNSGDDLKPFGFLNYLRRDAYRASQDGRLDAK